MSNLDVKQQLLFQPTDEELKAHAEFAKKSFSEKLSLTQKDIENNPRLSSITDFPANLEKSLVNGTGVLGCQFAISSALIHSWMYTNTPLHFPDMNIRFNADVWGFGIGGGIVWLSGYFSNSTGAEILGDVNFVLTTNPVHTEITFKKGRKLIGGLIGGGLNIQAGVFSGTGYFSKWT